MCVWWWVWVGRGGGACTYKRDLHIRGRLHEGRCTLLCTTQHLCDNEVLNKPVRRKIFTYG